MCGFLVCCGAPENLDEQLGTLAHRGPDDRRVETVGSAVTDAVFGFHRLAIIDPQGSPQPLHYAGRWTVVANGQVYNYRELRAELVREHGATFATNGDIEVLAAALHHWGPAGLTRLRGMFAFAAWDAQERVLHAGRDPFGIKPLYYHQNSQALWLASERKALTPSAEIDREALAHYLTLQYVPEPLTLDPQIRRLGAGQRLTWRPGGGLEIVTYSRPSLRPNHNADLNAVAAEILEALTDSVDAHLVSDVPVGAFLSSGIDSTAVVALARRRNPEVTAFAAGFDVPGYSEIEAASDTAQALGVRLIPTVVTAEDVIRELPRIVWHLDDPVADPSAVPLYFLARTAAQRVKVVLSGEGADELFGGYHIYREPFALAPVSHLPLFVQTGLGRLSDVMPQGLRGKSYLRRATTPIEQRYYGNARIFTGPEKKRLIGEHLPHAAVTATAFAEAAAQGLDDPATMQVVDLRTWLPGDILTKADRLTMAHSLELRVPFLDRRVLQAASAIPTRLKLPLGTRTTKAVLRHALRHLVPPGVVHRPKLGFPTPTAHWLRGELGAWAHEILSSSAAGHLINLDFAREMLVQHQRGEAGLARKLWTITTFCMWHAVFVENRFQKVLASPHP